MPDFLKSQRTAQWQFYRFIVHAKPLRFFLSLPIDKTTTVLEAGIKKCEESCTTRFPCEMPEKIQLGEKPWM